MAVEKGWVNLQRHRRRALSKESLGDAFRKLLGVIGVTNSISVKTSVQTADIKKKVEAALTRNAQVEARAIRVNVSNGIK